MASGSPDISPLVPCHLVRAVGTGPPPRRRLPRVSSISELSSSSKSVVVTVAGLVSGCLVAPDGSCVAGVVAGSHPSGAQRGAPPLSICGVCPCMAFLLWLSCCVSAPSWLGVPRLWGWLYPSEQGAWDSGLSCDTVVPYGPIQYVMFYACH